MVLWPTAESRKSLFKPPLTLLTQVFSVFKSIPNEIFQFSLEFWIFLSHTLCVVVIRHIDSIFFDLFCATSAHSRAHGLCFSVFNRSVRRNVANKM